MLVKAWGAQNGGEIIDAQLEGVSSFPASGLAAIAAVFSAVAAAVSLIVVWQVNHPPAVSPIEIKILDPVPVIFGVPTRYIEASFINNGNKSAFCYLAIIGLKSNGNDLLKGNVVGLSRSWLLTVNQALPYPLERKGPSLNYDVGICYNCPDKSYPRTRV